MKQLYFALAALIMASQAHADPLDEILAGSGDPGAQLAGVAVAYGNELGGIAAAKGCARFESSGQTCAEPLTPQHMVRVASISKLVTALGAMKLVQAGKLKLHQDVSKVLGFRLRNPAFPDKPITLAQLLSHTSSLRDGETYWAEYPDTLQSILGTDSTHFSKDEPPGYFTYSNLNYGVIATMIERASGQRFDHYMQSAVFKPLGIVAGYNWSGVPSTATRIATLYRTASTGGPWLPQIDDFGGGPPMVHIRSRTNAAVDFSRLRAGTNGTLFSPQGGLRISIEGLAAIAQVVTSCGRYKGKVFLSCKTINAMAEPTWKLKEDLSNGDDESGFYQAFGLGIHRFHIDDTRELMAGHYAEAYGLRGAVIVNPATGKYAIYLMTGMADTPEKLKSEMPGLTTPEAALTKFLAGYIK